jgi:hypothetical protein
MGKTLQDVLIEEGKAIAAKRRKTGSKDRQEDLFGIALSGGGIRSATFNLGILKVLNKCGVLPLADYLSTVSGGGYIGGYVHAKLRKSVPLEGSCKDEYKLLFTADDVDHLMNYGNYLVPGKRGRLFLNILRLAGAYTASLMMNLVWIVFGLISISLFLKTLFQCLGQNDWQALCDLGIFLVLITLGVHFFLHGLRFYKLGSLHLWSSNCLNYFEGLLLAGFVVFGVGYGAAIYQGYASPAVSLWASLTVFVVTGFFANPNLLTMHRFYRDRIAKAFMEAAGAVDQGLTLEGLNPGKKPEEWACAPYPLINTCLNLLGEEDDAFKGKKTSDFYLLSPLYCGSRLTGYADSDSPGYRNMTLSTAVAVSGAAVNPDMGVSTNKILAFIMTILNLRLGYWAINPREKRPKLFSWLTWWPYYNILELLSKTHTKRARVNISDGGHIENLAVYELIRRKCRLIIATDAGADPDYGFSDLRNLVLRARNELGINIKFREGMDPESLIRPLASRGYSESPFVIADISELAGKQPEGAPAYTGILVYVKSSLRQQTRYHGDLVSESFNYKIYHPAFPHETTADQFFDKAQWKAYYSLGRFIAGDLLRINVTTEDGTEDAQLSNECRVESICDLYETFDKIKTRADLDAYLRYMSD